MEPSGLGIAFSLLSDPVVLGLIVAGTVAGVIIGALPGLSSSMGVALLLPFSLYLDPVPAIALLSALYCAGTFGGSITAVLINAPGAPPAVATAFDGYPMALKGEAGRALGIAAVSSVSGGIISVLTLLLAAPLLARIAYSFGPPEYFALGRVRAVDAGIHRRGVSAQEPDRRLPRVAHRDRGDRPDHRGGAVHLRGAAAP